MVSEYLYRSKISGGVSNYYLHIKIVKKALFRGLFTFLGRFSATVIMNTSL
jgi:hypothetical protein